MKLPDPYRLADRATEQINRKAVAMTGRTKRRLIISGFDELNVLNLTDQLYAEIDRNNREKFTELFIGRYAEMTAYLTGRKVLEEDEDEIDELAEMFLAGLLDEPNETTKYTYSAEVMRKRDRAKEAMLSVPTKTLKQIQLDRHIRYFMQMTGWYADFVSQGAEIEAYRDAGIQMVKRHEADDTKTCRECREANGEIYDIDDIPPLPHLRCRRWFTKA